MSRLGFGAAPLGNEYGDVDETEMERAVQAAIDCGVTFFDTSPYYGRTVSESRLGAALAGRRDEVVLCTKAGRYDLALPDGFDFSPSRLRRSVDESLGRLRTDRLDILLLHDIEFSEPTAIVDEAVPVLHELKQQGKTRAVGVSSYRIDVLLQVLRSSPLDVVLPYCRTDLIDDSAVVDLVPAAGSAGVSVLAASPLHMGLLAPGGGPPWHPALAGARTRAGALRAAASELGLSLTDAALSFSLGLSGIASTIVGVSSSTELQQNVAAWRHPVDLADIDRLLDRVAAIEVESWPCGIWPMAATPARRRLSEVMAGGGLAGGSRCGTNDGGRFGDD